MFTRLKHLQGVPRYANQHLLSRLSNEVATDEHRQMVDAVEEYTNQLLAELDALMEFIGADMEPNLVGNLQLGGNLTLMEGTSMRVVFNSLHQRCLIKRAWEDVKQEPDSND